MLCECGCGQEVKVGNKFIHGHNRRNLASYTKKDRWAVQYDKCVECGTTSRRHIGKGLCTKCHRFFRYQLAVNHKLDKWSQKYDRCVRCETTDRPHRANGLCTRCYNDYVNRKKGLRQRMKNSWSWYYLKCKQCDTTERPHLADGLCIDCSRENKRDLSNGYKVCPVCGVKTVRLSQHLSIRAKKCKEHYDYQYKNLKMYFDSDLNLSDISEELHMGRHAVTAQFIRYFGKDETAERNEAARRCNISEKAVINKNYCNMYGTLVKYNSPNQGEITLRSKLEAKFAAYLDEQNLNWYYENSSFPYIDVNGKRRTYTPDFYIENTDTYIEVKGHDLVTMSDEYKVNWVRDNANINIEIKVL